MTKRKTPTAPSPTEVVQVEEVTEVLTGEKSPPKRKPTKVARGKMATKALAEAEEVVAPRSCVNCGQDWLEIQARERDGETYFYCQLCEHEWDAEEMESPFWQNLGRK